MMFFKKRCVLCKTKDEKINLKCVIDSEWDYSNKYWFHPECLNTVICDPDAYKTSTVDNALFYHNLLMEDKKVELKEIQNRNNGIKAQEQLECIK